MEQINEKEQENDTSSSSFTKGERAELEALKREKKVSILNSFKGVLNDDEYNKFLDSIDSFDSKDLEMELLQIYKKVTTETESKTTTRRVFAFTPTTKNSELNSLDNFIRSNL